MTAREVNFDGLPGLTHHYAGLSFGNEASTRHRYRVSNPQLAAAGVDVFLAGPLPTPAIRRR